MGGSFNPPHVGHLLAAYYVKATQPVDRVWWMPSHRHPFGKTLESFEHRVKMCEAMSKDASGWLEVTEIEREVPGDGRTVDTLDALVTRFPGHKFTLVIGSDILKDLPYWKDFERIRELARVLVLQRSGHLAPEGVGPALAEVSSTDLRARLLRGEKPEALMPSAVLAYIAEHGLYRR
jgi:nicotinate-nucleotide adenylyltransferase